MTRAWRGCGWHAAVQGASWRALVRREDDEEGDEGRWPWTGGASYGARGPRAGCSGSAGSSSAASRAPAGGRRTACGVGRSARRVFGGVRGDDGAANEPEERPLAGPI